MGQLTAEDAALWRALAVDHVREAHEEALGAFESQDWASPEDFLGAVHDRALAVVDER